MVPKMTQPTRNRVVDRLSRSVKGLAADIGEARRIQRNYQDRYPHLRD